MSEIEEDATAGVFTDIFPAEWAADVDFCEYLNELSGYALVNLKKGTISIIQQNQSFEFE